MNNTLIDMIGKQFDSLTVISRAPNRVSPSGNHVTRWHCRCECGNELDVDAYALRSGNTKSCGCKQHGRNFKDITGQKFDKLTVVRLEKTENKKTYWKCQCECGNFIIVSKSNLLNRNTKSCGCMNSIAEVKIANMLNDMRIKFIRAYSFADLIGPRGGRLLFDFGIVSNDNELICLIECQGIQHYLPNMEFGKQQREITDPQKKKYCNENNIILHEIKYNEDLQTALLNILTFHKLIPCQAS